jgi:FkbM family methyltransferase
MSVRTTGRDGGRRAIDIVRRVTGDKFVSYAQNREDVVLWRALGGVANGRYVEIGANDPAHFSVTKAFYDRGWRGLAVEPVPSFASRLRTARPEDVVVEAAVTREDGSITLHVIEGSGLSTVVDDVSSRHQADGQAVVDLEVRSVRLDTLIAEHGFDTGPVHFLLVDVEGAEADVLASVDLRAWRPWVVVVEATAPGSSQRTHQSWESALLGAGYEFTLFDGLSRFYVAQEHVEALRTSLDHPANVLDDFVDLLGDDQRSAELGRLLAQNEDLEAELRRLLAQNEALAAEIDVREAETQRWRAKALVTWAAGVAQAPEIAERRNEIDLLRMALDKAGKKNGRQAAQIKALRRRLRTAGGEAAAEPTALGKAVRSLTRHGR